MLSGVYDTGFASTVIEAPGTLNLPSVMPLSVMNSSWVIVGAAVSGTIRGTWVTAGNCVKWSEGLTINNEDSPRRLVSSAGLAGPSSLYPSVLIRKNLKFDAASVTRATLSRSRRG